MSRKVFLSDPFERNTIKKFIGERWSEFEEFSKQNRRRSAWNEDIDREERRKRLSYWFYTYLIGFMMMASLIGIVFSLICFAFKNPLFYTSIAVMILAIFLMKTKRHGVKVNIKLKNFPIPRRNKRKQLRLREKKIKKENEREILEFLEGRR